MFWYVFALWGVMELFLGVFVRSRASKGDRAKDGGTFGILWLVIGVAIFCTIFLAQSGFARLPDALRSAASWAGIAVMGVGIVVRATAIWTLRRFFTTDVAIRSDHQIVRTGLYSLVRHPSYTGALLTFLGFAVGVGTWIGPLLFVPVAVAFAIRIAKEERVLVEAFGEPYAAYQRETKRLIPFVF